MKTYRTRNPRKSPVWQCVQRHHDTFVDRYPDAYEFRLGPLRPVVSEVFGKFLQCGILERGFDRVRCDHCTHEYLVAFSCKGRWFCRSCHQRKILQTAAHLVDHILLPVPHRHVVLALPKALRPLFRRDRNLLRRLCTVAQQTLTQLLRTALGLPRGHPAFFLTLHTFGEYLDFHPHIHALVAEGLLDSEGQWHPAPEIPHGILESVFRDRIFAELPRLRRIPPQLVERMRGWKHTGFNVDATRSVPPENRAEREELCQYILRNPFSTAKITLEQPGDVVIYRSRLNAKIHRNFEVFAAEDFLAALSQHIPDRGTQMVRYYGLYSNKSRGCRSRTNPAAKAIWPNGSPPPPTKLPNRKWRDLIRQAWHDGLVPPEPWRRWIHSDAPNAARPCASSPRSKNQSPLRRSSAISTCGAAPPPSPRPGRLPQIQGRGVRAPIAPPRWRVPDRDVPDAGLRACSDRLNTTQAMGAGLRGIPQSRVVYWDLRPLWRPSTATRPLSTPDEKLRRRRETAIDTPKTARLFF